MRTRKGKPCSGAEVRIWRKENNYTWHGNFGEMVVDVDLEGTGHIERISMRRITALDAPMHHGMDACTGLYDVYHGGK